jgi:hypothetical protein
MAIELRGGELVRAMVIVSHQVADENARVRVPTSSLLPATQVAVRGVSRLRRRDRWHHSLPRGTNIEYLNVFVTEFTDVYRCLRPDRR